MDNCINNRVYFQTQGLNDQGQNFHSDGCTFHYCIDRAYFHNLLDEWIDNLKNLPQGLPRQTLLEGPSLVFGICHAHHD